MSETVVLKSISTHCPICNNKIEMKINSDTVTKAKNYPIAISTMHCNFTIILYIDANFKVRGVESAVKYDDSVESASKRKIPELKNENDFDERVYYTSNRSNQEFLEMPIPNLLERQILLTISKKRDYVSIRELKEKMKKVGKALNLIVDDDLIERIVTKYTQNGLISKCVI